MLLSPVDSFLTNEALPSFSWESIPAADHYILTVSENADLSAPTVQESGVTTTTYMLISPLPDTAETIYYWGVTAIDANGVSGTPSPVWSFVLDTEGPVGSVVLNGGDAETPLTTMTAALSASDPNGVVEMYLSKDGTFTDGAFEIVALT